MTKLELSRILHSLQIPVGEGEHFMESSERMPKVAYWEYLWNDNMASGDDYEVVVTYQISFMSTRPRDQKLLALKSALNDAGIHPDIYHEYVKGDKSPGFYHSYCSVDVEEEIDG